MHVHSASQMPKPAHPLLWTLAPQTPAAAPQMAQSLLSAGQALEPELALALVLALVQ